MNGIFFLSSIPISLLALFANSTETLHIVCHGYLWNKLVLILNIILRQTSKRYSIHSLSEQQFLDVWPNESYRMRNLHLMWTTNCSDVATLIGTKLCQVVLILEKEVNTKQPNRVKRVDIGGKENMFANLGYFNNINDCIPMQLLSQRLALLVACS